MSSLQGLGVDNEIGERIEKTKGANIPNLGSFQAKRFGLTVAAFGTGALMVNTGEQWAGAIQQHAHDASSLDIHLFLAPFPLDELRMITGLACFFG